LLGDGEGIILVHGGMEYAQSHYELALDLSKSFKVCFYDRRGRGESGQYDDGYNVHKDVEDIKALIKVIDAKYIFGISSGAIIALQATLDVPNIQKAIIYEPPLYGFVSTDWMPRFDKEIAEGNINAALLTGMLGTQMGPAFFSKIPRWLLGLFFRIANLFTPKDSPYSFKKLIPTLHYDSQIAIETIGWQEISKNINTDILLMGGQVSPAYLQNALDELEKILPNVQRVVLPKTGHGGLGNRNQGGRPGLVAEEITKFLVKIKN
jgi:pimeloyl-ACP methyl ester carboxylesterase